MHVLPTHTQGVFVMYIHYQPRGVASKKFCIDNQRATAIGRKVDDLLPRHIPYILEPHNNGVVYINEFLSVVCA